MREKHRFSLEERGGFASNLFYAIVAQGVSLASSVLMSLVVPKLLGIEDYAYWQLFVLYSGYVGLALFGVHDGVFLRLGGIKVSDIDWPRVKTQFALVTGFQLLFGLAVILVTCVPFVGDSRQIIFLLVVVDGLLVNPSAFLFYVFRAANLPSIYSTASMASGTVWVAMLIILTACNPEGFALYVLCYLACQGISSLFGYLYIAGVFKCPFGSLRQGLRDIWGDLIAGIKVTVAYYAGSLVIGSCRMLIDWRWGIETFGKFSFSVSLVNFLLSFMAQVSMVLFPVIRRMGEESQTKAYINIRSGLVTVLPLVYLAYYPGCELLSWWLPQYAESLRYLGIILPICYFDCKVQLLVNTYLKSLRKENALLWINVGTLALSLVLCLFAVLALSDVVFAALSIVIAVAFRSIVAEVYLDRYIHVGGRRLLATEIALAAAFVVTAYYASSPALTVVSVLVFYLLNFSQIRSFVSLLGNRLSRGRK